MDGGKAGGHPGGGSTRLGHTGYLLAPVRIRGTKTSAAPITIRPTPVIGKRGLEPVLGKEAAAVPEAPDPDAAAEPLDVAEDAPAAAG